MVFFLNFKLRKSQGFFDPLRQIGGLERPIKSINLYNLYEFYKFYKHVKIALFIKPPIFHKNP